MATQIAKKSCNWLQRCMPQQFT